MTKLIYVHGWGFTPDFWAPLHQILSPACADFADLGFCGSSHMPLDEEAVYITHSMGLARFLDQGISCRGLIVINGFTCFCAGDDWPTGVAPRMLDRMIRQFQRNPQAVWCEFMKNSGLLEPEFLSDYNVAALLAGLEYLKAADLRSKYETLDCPKLVIAGQGDLIVPQELTTSSFGQDVIWYKGANHLLPLCEAQALAGDIQSFLGSLRE